ncbi:GDP-mannose 4,6-dehydratase [Thermodesulfobacterium sp. TA1]|uniref:GDP-mannose 4,6-dehydratase n=1 Tax=Thermodesulfobacterium sp. TA1 TaxID=2234087 RepID=UPI00143D620B|nr:GDP-mannose 4,6-dehydratase [Thermodesulfobacterium sp. TA1]
MVDFWIDRPVFVTGATGLLGSWLVKRLVEVKADVICLIRDWVPQSELILSGFLDKVKVVRGDVRDQELIERVLGEYEIDTVFHLAAQTIVGIANRNPVSTLDTNIRGTWVLLEACRRSSTVKQIIVASSDKAYGEHKILPYTEENPLQGKHPYDVSKSCADLIAQMYAYTYRLPVVITRCGNLYGGGDLNWNRLIPGTIRSILRGQKPLIRSDGNYVRDYFYVEDAVEAYLLLAQKLSEDRNLIGEAFNFSNEEPITVIELVNLIIKLMEANLTPLILNEASNEIREQYLSSKKARQILKWKPLFSLEEGLNLTINWYKNFFVLKDKIKKFFL